MRDKHLLTTVLFFALLVIKPNLICGETVLFSDMNLHLNFTIDLSLREATVGTDLATDHSNALAYPEHNDPYWEQQQFEYFWHNIVIPSTIVYEGNTYPVTRIGRNAFYTETGIYTISLPETIESIGKYAFYFCVNLQSINIPDNVTIIESGTFVLCSSLTSLSLPTGITTIQDQAFSDCYGLEEINIPGTCTYIGEEAFKWCRSLRKLTIEDGTSTLQCEYTRGLGIEYQGIDEPKYRGLFADCPIKELYLGRNLSYPTIGNKLYNPFYCITNYGVSSSGFQTQTGKTFDSVIFGPSVTDIPDELFYYSFIKNEIVLPSGLKSIGARAFSNINYSDGTATLSQYKLTLPESVETLGVNCFTYSGLRFLYSNAVTPPVSDSPISSFTVVVPENSGTSYRIEPNWKSSVIIDPADEVLTINVRTAGSLYDRILAQNKQLADVIRLKLKGSLDETDWNKIREMTRMYELDLSELELDTIPNGILSGLNNINTLMLPNTTKKISASAFTDCSHLTGVFHIPSSCTEIGDNAFRKTSIEGLDYDGSINIGQGAFSYCKLLNEIEIKGETTIVGESAFSSSGLRRITIGKGVELGEDAFGFNYKLTELVIKDSVSTIGGEAFQYCKALRKIVFEGRVNHIGENIFKLCDSLSEVHVTNASLWSQLPFPESSAPLHLGAKLYMNGKPVKNVELSNDVVFISNYSFYGCDSIESIALGNGLRNIQPYAFYGCKNLAEINIPSSMISIGAYAFANCEKVVSLDIPTTIESIGSYAFQNCIGMEKVVAHWKDPITIEAYTTFKGVNSNCYLYIPIGTASKYSTAGWNLPNLKAAGILSISGNLGGSISCYDVTITNREDEIFFNPYQSFNISFIPENGYHLKKVRMNGLDVTNTLDNNNLFIEEPEEDFSVSVVFADDNIATGDVNGDGDINSQDVLAVANYILKSPPETFYDYAADMNDDDIINITDAVIIESLYNNQ